MKLPLSPVWLLAVLAALLTAGAMCDRVSEVDRQRREERLNDLTPDWTADGNTVIGYANWLIYGADASGGRFWPITKKGTGTHYEAALSSTGLLAYVSSPERRSLWRRLLPDGRRHLLTIVSIDGDRHRTLYREPYREPAPEGPTRPRSYKYPAWSPDGRLLAVQLRKSVVVLNAEGTELHRWTHPSIPDEDMEWYPPGSPVWSWNSEWIAQTFISDSHRRSLLSVTRPDGSDRRDVWATEGETFAWPGTPAWSRDDTHLYFTTKRQVDDDDARAVLHSLRVADGDLRALWEFPPRWRAMAVKMSPADDRLLLTGFNLSVMDIAEGTLKQIGDGGFYASWSPTGDRIAVQDLAAAAGGGPLYVLPSDGASRVMLINRDEQNRLTTSQRWTVGFGRTAGPEYGLSYDEPPIKLARPRTPSIDPSDRSDQPQR